MKKLMFVFVALLMACSVQAESAREAWGKMVGAKSIKSAAYEYVQNNPALPNILIYGDSISIGYTPYVRKALAGKANVYRLYCNGGDSSSVQTKVDKMLSVMCDQSLDDPWTFEWNIILINVGLHDLKYMNGKTLDTKGGKQVFTVEQYAENFKGDIEYLKKIAPKAKLVFVTTTPVPENSSGRVAGDALRYNVAALAVCKEYPEVKVFDLYGFTKPRHQEWWSAPGNVHYNLAGCTAQGNEIARLIRQMQE